MAYTANPENNTYGTKRIPAAYGIDLRADSLYVSGGALSQDAGMVNLIPIKGATKEEPMQAITRQPITASTVVDSNLINRGCYVWQKTPTEVYYFSVNGTGVYSSTNGTTWALVNTLLTTATTPVRFTEFINDTNVKSLVMVDGVEGFVFTSNAAGTKITDPEFPNPHVPFPVFLDGYLFLARANTGDIYNSNLNDPAAWTAGDFLSSELYPDDIQALVKVNNYILAIGVQGSEFFYDVANPTGSPLARYEGGSFPFGTLAPNSVAVNKNYVVLVANTNDGEISIKYIEDFKAKDIDPGFLAGVINSRLISFAAPTTAAAMRGFFFRQRGELCYALSLKGDDLTANIANKTFVFSFDTGQWTEFRVGANGESPFPVYFTTMPVAGFMSTFVSGHYGGRPFFGRMEEKLTAADSIGSNNPAIYTELRTPNYSADTWNNKTMSRFGVELTENTSSASTSGSTITMQVSWSDDDYSSFSTARSLVFGAKGNYPFITQLGQFRQRNFKLVYSGSVFLRYKAINMDINKGSQ